MEPQPTSQRGKPPRPYSHRRPGPGAGPDSQTGSGGNRGSPYRGRGGDRGRGRPRRRGRGGGGYADRSGPGPVAPTGPAGPGGPASIDMGRSQFTGLPLPVSMPMQPFMPFQGPGNPPWWGYMNPPPHPTGNPNFAPMPPMFNPTIPMFSPFNPNPNPNFNPDIPRRNQSQAQTRTQTRTRDPELVEAPNPPEATAQYLAQASQPASPTPNSQPLLIILDLNGTLIHRRNRKFPPKFTRRSLLDKFLATLLLKHKVMVWSSSQPKTVKAICQQLFSPMQRKALLAEWGRDKLNLTASQYKNKVQVYKTLETVWADQSVQARYPKTLAGNENPKSRWDQSNTVLLDDSKLKALSEPFNIIELPEYEGFETPGQDGETIFPKVLSRLEMLSRHDDVSKVLHGWSDANANTDTKDFLDFELDELDRQQIFSVSNSNSTTEHQSQSSKEEAHIQKRLLRKAMKHERKAAKEARDLKAINHNPNSPFYGSTPDAGSEQGAADEDDNGLSSKQKKQQMREHQRKHRRAEKRAENRQERSPSGSLSSQSVSSRSGNENQLLDRLEESLTV